MSPRFPTLLSGLLLPLLLAEVSPSQEPNAKAVRLLDPLTKRPGSAPLFERFVNAWLDTDTLEGLGKFLAGRVAASPTTPNRLLLALFYSRQGEPVKALEEFRAALASDPGSAEIWYQKALLESRTLDFESALVSLGKCLGAHPPAGLSVQASQLLGRLQVRAGRTEEALKTWRALMEARPADEELREDILELQISENLWPAAQETATALVERTADPYRRVLRRMRLGDVFDRAGQRDKALETFAACLADTGEGSWLEKEILGQMEKLFRREDDVAGLKDYFAGLLPKHSRRAGLQRAQARLLMETGETDAAIACGRALMALSPGDRAVREEFIALLTGAGRAVDAIPQVEQLLHHTPDDLELRLTLADLKYTAKDAPGALAELRVYEQKAASQEGTPLRVAGLLDRYGMADDAIQTLRTALARTPNQPELQLMLASLLHSSGKKEEALAEWHRLASDGSLPIVQQTARAMHSRGEGAAAWQVMQAASSKAGNDAIFLSLLCSLADNAERAREAGPLALRLVELSKSTADLNSALEVALRVIRLAENGDTFTAKLAQTATTEQSLCLLATLREAARDTLGANDALEKARAMSPELALSQVVRLWTMRGDFGQAAMAAEKLFNSPGGRQGHVAEMLVSLHQRAGNPEAALRWTQEWRKLVPGAVAPVIGEAKLLQAAGREADALSALRTAAGRFEGNSDIRAQLAAASLQNGRTAEALRLYSGLYEDAPDLAAKMRWVQQWAQAALNAGRLEELISQFEDRRRENRESVVPLMALAELHRVAENYDARRQALMEAARLKPGDSEIALEIARLESREQNDEAAIRTLRPYLAKDSSGRVSALMAELLLNTGREEEGLKLITESTAPTAGSVENAAISLARRGDEKAALTWLRAQREAWPDDWRLAYLQCVLEWRTEQTADTPERLLKLAAASSPLSRLNTSSAVAPSATFESQVIQIMPAGTRRFFKLLQASSAVSVMTGRSLSYVILPSDPEEVQEFAAALLLEISKSAPPEKSAVWMEALERLGFPSARLIPELPPIRRLLLTDRGEDLTSLLEAHPESRPLLALAAYTAAYSNWELPAESRMAEQAWAAFRQEAPLAALFLALPGAGHSGKPAAWEEEVLAAAGKMEKAPPLILAAVSRGAGLFSDDEDSRAAQAVNPEWRKRLISLAQRWQQALDAAGTPASLGWDARSFIFTGLAREYTAAKEAPALASLLDAEWRWYESRPQPPRQSSGEESLVRSLEFPPKSLPGLPDSVLSYFQRYLTPEMAAATAPLIKQPALRILLLSKAPEAKGAAEALKEWLDGHTGTAGPFILGAAWEEKAGNLATAAELALKALYLPVSEEVRRHLDSAIAFWATRKGKPGDALYAAGREALLRLRRDAVTAERRSELSKFMDMLGLTEEADRLMRQGRLPAAGGTPMERAQRLLHEGKSKEALPILVADLRNWARQCLAAGSFTVSKDDVRTWRTEVQLNGLLPQVMAAMLPPSPRPPQLAEYAVACQLTGDLAAARESYERALAGGLKTKQTSLFLNLLFRSGDPFPLIPLLGEMPDAWTNEGVRAWSQTFVSTGVRRRGTLEDRVAFGRFLERMIDLMPESANATFPVDHVLSVLESGCEAGDFYRTGDVTHGGKAPLWVKRPAPAEETARVEALVKERAALFERLCRKLMERPGCGVQAWTSLHTMLAAVERKPEEILPEAFAMLPRELKAGSSKKKNRGSGGESDLTRVLTVLMRDVSASGRAADFARLVVPAIKEARPPAVAARLLENWPLYEVPADRFAEEARAVLKSRGARAWGDIIDIACFRQTGAALAPDLRRFCTDAANKDRSAVMWHLADWCDLLEKTSGHDAAVAFIQAVLDSLAGPEKERAALFKPEHSDLNPGHLRQVLGRLLDSEHWISFGMRYVRDEIVPFTGMEEIPELFSGSGRPEYFGGDRGAERHSTISRQFLILLGKRDFAAARAYLDSLPLSEDLTGFFGAGNLVTGVAAALTPLSPEELEALGFGGDRAKLSFGRQLLLLLRGECAYVRMCNAMAAWRDRIEALPEPHRRRVIGDLRDIKGSIYTSMDASVDRVTLTAEGKAFYEWLSKEPRAKEKTEMDQSVEHFLKEVDGGSITDAGSLVELTNGLLWIMAAANDPRSREVVRRACRLEETFRARAEGSGVVASVIEMLGDTRGGDLTREVIGNMVGMLLEGLRQSGADPQSFDMISRNAGGLLLLRGMDSIGDQLESFLQLLGPVLQPGEARLVAVWLLHSTLAPQDCAAGLQWLAENGSRFPWRELVEETEMAFRTWKAAQEWQWDKPGTHARGTVREEEMPPDQRHFLAVLRDSSLPLRLRLPMAISLTDASMALEPPLLLETGRLLREALAAHSLVWPSTEARVFAVLARVPPAAMDRELMKSLLSLTTLPRLRDNENDLSDGLTALVHFALKAGDQATVDRLFDLDIEFPGLGALSVLAREGESKRLAEALNKKPAALHERYTTSPLAVFDAPLQSRLPGVLSGVADPELRFEAAVTLDRLNDGDPPQPGLRPRAERQAELVRQFLSMNWRSPEVKDRVLAALIDTDEVPDALWPAVTAAAARVSLHEAPLLEDDAEGRYESFHEHLTGRALTQANPGPLLSALREVRLAEEDDSSDYYYRASRILRAAAAAVLKTWPQTTADNQKEICAAWRRCMIDPGGRRWENTWPDVLRFGIALHGLAGRMEELTSWHAALPEADRLFFRDRLNNRSAGGILPEYLSAAELTGSPAEKSQRLQTLFKVLVVNPLGGGPGPSPYEEYIACEGATAAEFLKLEESFVRAHPDNPWLVVAFGRAREATGDWPGVLTRVTTALAKEKPSRSSAWSSLLELRTLALEKTGHPGETLTEIARLRELPPPDDSAAMGQQRAVEARLMKRLAP